MLERNAFEENSRRIYRPRLGLEWPCQRGLDVLRRFNEAKFDVMGFSCAGEGGMV